LTMPEALAVILFGAFMVASLYHRIRANNPKSISFFHPFWYNVWIANGLSDFLALLAEVESGSYGLQSGASSQPFQMSRFTFMPKILTSLIQILCLKPKYHIFVECIHLTR